MTNVRVNLWERFLDSLSTEGGHIAVWMTLLVAGALCVKLSIAYGHEIMVASLTGLGICLKGSARSNLTRQMRNGKEDHEPS